MNNNTNNCKSGDDEVDNVDITRDHGGTAAESSTTTATTLNANHQQQDELERKIRDKLQLNMSPSSVAATTATSVATTTASATGSRPRTVQEISAANELDNKIMARKVESYNTTTGSTTSLSDNTKPVPSNGGSPKSNSTTNYVSTNGQYTAEIDRELKLNAMMNTQSYRIPDISTVGGPSITKEVQEQAPASTSNTAFNDKAYLDGLQNYTASSSGKEDIIGTGGMVRMTSNAKLEKGGGIGLGPEYDIEEIDAENMGLAVAKPVMDDDNMEDDDNKFLPAAVEFDPDQKQAEFEQQQRKRRRRIIIGIALVVVIITSIAVGVTVSITKKQAAPVNPRTQLGIQDILMETIPEITNETFYDLTDPYTKAYNWITYNDPQQLVPGVNETFLQRYLLAYYYYATSERGDWKFCYEEKNETTTTTGDGMTTTTTTTVDNTTTTTNADRNKVTCRKMNWSKFKGLNQPVLRTNHWLSNKKECFWSGIKCDDQGHIIEINTNGVGQSGLFPKIDIINLFPFLSILYLGVGNITGTIPALSFKSLSKLSIPSNQLSGPVPPILLQESRLLKDIQFAFNNFTSINLDTIHVNMKELNIDSTNYNGNLTDKQFQRLASLSILDMRATNIRGTIPSTLFNLPYIAVIELTNNHITGTIPSNTQLPDLSRLQLDKNKLTGPIPVSLYTSAAAMDTLQLQENQLTGTISENIVNVSRIAYVALEKNNFRGTIPSIIGQLAALRTFTLSGTNLSGEMPTEICNMRSTGLVSLQADCLSNDQTGVAELSCPSDCCTICCNEQGDNCIDTNLINNN